jgi:glucan phosphorylase
MRYSKSNMSWEQAFKEVHDGIDKRAYLMKVTNELFPKEDGTLWVDWTDLSKEDRDKVWKKAY